MVSRVPHQVPAGVCVAWGGLSHACSFVSARARESVLGQATWRSLLEAVHLAGVACVAKKKIKASIMAHVLRIFIRHVGLWWSGQGECGGEGFCLVGACAETLHMCCYHCLFICSRRCHLCLREFVLRFLAEGYVSHLWFLILGRLVCFLGDGVSQGLRVSVAIA